MCYLCDERERANTMVPTVVESKPEVKEVPTSRVLTREMVLRGRPCAGFRNRFTKRFPETVEVTVDLAVSQASDWDWWWAASNLLSSSTYQEARKRFNEASRVRDAELAPYNALMTKAYDEYYVARNVAMNEAYELGLGYEARYNYVDEKSKQVIELPEAARDAAGKIADKRLREAQAKAWAELFLTDGEAYSEQHKNDEPFEDTWVEEIQDYDVYNEYGDNEEEEEDY